MKCTKCDGTGLISSYEVCSVCNGIGHDGSIPVPETIIQKVKRSIKKK